MLKGMVGAIEGYFKVKLKEEEEARDCGCGQG